MMSTSETRERTDYRPGAPLLFQPIFDFTGDQIRIQSFDTGCTLADDRACIAAALHASAPLPEAAVNVNVGAAFVLNDDGLADFIIATARAEEVPPPIVAIEVEREITAEELERFDTKVKNLRRDGIRVAFRIRQADTLLKVGFPPDFLKIGRELVTSVDRDAARKELLQSITGVMRSAGRRVVAEGVETWNEVRALRAAGIHLIQGPLLCRPAGRPVREESVS